MKKEIVFLAIGLLIISCDHKKEKSVAMLENKIKVISHTQSPLAESIKKGKEVYLDMCVTCHLPNGKGVPKVYPPLANSDYLMEKEVESIKAIKYGMQGEIVVNDIQYNQVMSPLGLENDEVADVMNYIRNSWGNKNIKMITEKEVAAISKN
ncbi:cytochrome c [uncultured Polaribacter sp.]|uniref:c-type cytochrome n=1 Tax=uncultured Polaribacter sp. TaxID=174711 RepID=UPI00261269C9|nr:cytochrome c [uncultured Polaribacter sp.]